MKTNRPTLILILLALLLSAVSCRFGEQALAPADPAVQGDSATPAPGEANQPAATQASGEAMPAAEAAATAKAGWETLGNFVLDTPDQGLGGLERYRQRLTSTIEGTFKGQPYSYSETVERTVSGSDETERVEATTNGEALYRFTARLGETVYSQTNPVSPCRAVPAADQPLAENPARKLPPVYGAALVDNAALDGAPAAHYTFDAPAVPYLAGEGGQATGELWVAEQGGVVLRYELTMQVKEGEFTGQRAWQYTLEQGEFSAALPENCQPLLDLPTPPGAAEVVNQPGFMRYTVQSGYEEVRQFYLSALPGAGWQPLPATLKGPEADAPQDVVVLHFSKASPDGSGQLAVIQLSQSGGTTSAAVQVVKTKAAVTADDPTGQSPAAEEGEEEQPPAGAETQPKLPVGVPVYAGGKIASQIGAMVMFTTPDAPEQVIEFYASWLEADGWEKAQDTTAQGTSMQVWEKGPETLMVVVSQQGGETMVVLSAG